MAPEEDNHSPELTFTVSKLGVPKNTNITLTVDATDPDGDAITVFWAVTRNGQPSGTLNPAQQGQPTITWTAPAIVGRDTITIEASDGKGGSKTLVETILVGTLKSQSIISLNQIWETAESPFIVRPSGDNLVIENATLTIEPGCVLLIDVADRGINVKRTLLANGTAQSPIVIRPNARAAEPGFWPGIYVEPEGVITPKVRLAHTAVLYATEAVKSTTGGHLFLDGCQVMFSSEAAIYHQSPDSLEVKNTAITNNLKTGIRIHRLPGLPMPPTVVISNDSIALNGDLTGETAYVDQAAIYIDISDADAAVPIDISGNEISRNGFPGIQLVKASYPVIGNNAIYFNELGKSGARYNVRLDNDFGGSLPTIDARNNYWGVVDSLDIEGVIRDSADDGSITVKVLFEPWLNAKP